MFKYFKDIPGYEFLAGHAIETQFEVYEDNGGGLYLCILNEDGKCLRIFENWEYTPGSLMEAISLLAENETAYESWDGDLSERTDCDADWLYHNLQAALVADNDGVSLHNLGAAGRRSLLGEGEAGFVLP